MKIAYNNSIGLVIQEVTETPEFQFIEVTEAVQLKIDSFVKPVINNDFTDIVESATVEEIAELNAQKVQEYRKDIYEMVDYLTNSAKERALGKVGENLTKEQLKNLEVRYLVKKDTALALINDEQYYDQIMASLIAFEVENDFAGEKLTQTVGFLNSTFNASIPTDVSRLKQYCHLIVAKYNLGKHADSMLTSLIEYFRSKMITWLDVLDFEKIEHGKAIVKSINSSNGIEDILLIKNKFDEL